MNNIKIKNCLVITNIDNPDLIVEDSPYGMRINLVDCIIMPLTEYRRALLIGAGPETLNAVDKMIAKTKKETE